MEKIKKYIKRFYERKEIPVGYNLTMRMWRELSNNARSNPVDATGTTFLYGYAKGYRAAMAEMKKSGAVQ